MKLKKRQLAVDTNQLNTIAIKLSKLMMEAISQGLPNAAWCIDLAMTACGWEQHAQNDILAKRDDNSTNMYVMNKIIKKIERDKGVKIWH